MRPSTASSRQRAASEKEFESLVTYRRFHEGLGGCAHQHYSCAATHGAHTARFVGKLYRDTQAPSEQAPGPLAGVAPTSHGVATGCAQGKQALGVYAAAHTAGPQCSNQKIESLAFLAHRTPALEDTG